MYNRVYKKLFIKNAFKLFFSGAAYNVINFLAVLFFSRAKRRSRILVFTDRLLNKKICECRRLQEKCEYYKNKLEKNNKKYAPVWKNGRFFCLFKKYLRKFFTKANLCDIIYKLTKFPGARFADTSLLFKNRVHPPQSMFRRIFEYLFNLRKVKTNHVTERRKTAGYFW